jgi:hypothetical protein
MTMKRKCRRAPQVRLILGYETNFMLTTQRIYSTRFASSLMRGVSGDDPEGGAGSGVPRPRLVTADSGGPGHRPPGIMTWLRGARCTDPEAMPEMEARPPAENRHVERREASVPRHGTRRASPARTSRVSQTRQQNECACRRSARPSIGVGGEEIKTNPGARTRRGNEEHCAV